MASIHGLFATVSRIVHITTKTALIGLTRAVALDIARTGVISNAICPGIMPAIDWRLRHAP
jgi:3-hydroxybutyrate dehydrogenase